MTHAFGVLLLLFMAADVIVGALITKSAYDTYGMCSTVTTKGVVVLLWSMIILAAIGGFINELDHLVNLAK